jgi:putative ABC transport system permease protein
MNFRDFRIGWRLLIQEPAHSLVVVLGLSVGFTVCFLLLGFVHHSFSYDATVPGVDRIYVVKTQFNYNGSAAAGVWRQNSSQMLNDVATKSGLQVESSGAFTISQSMQVNRVVQEVKLTLVHPTYPHLFGIKALEGDLQAAITRPDALALTAEVARQLFGDIHAVGKTVEIAGKSYLVAAILNDPPSTTTFPYAALAGVNSAALVPDLRAKVYDNGWNALRGIMFLKLGAGVSPESVEQVFREAIDRSPVAMGFPPELLAQLGSKKLMEIRLSPLRNAYLDPDISVDDSPIPHGDERALLGLAAIALLILLLAAINYVNLATVRTLRRQREIAVRKVMGASLTRVIGQFFAESLLVSLLATGLGLLLALILKPVFSDLINRNLDDLFSPVSLGASLLLGILLGILTGAYPIWVAVHIRPSQALSGRGNSETLSGLWIRRILTVMQFSTAMGLCGVSLVIALQTDYATKLNPGFDPSPLLVIDLPTDLSNPANKAFYDEAARQPGVSGVAAAWDAIGRHKALVVNTYRHGGDAGVALVIKGISPDFFKTYAIDAIAGRVLNSKFDNNESSVIVINKAAVSALGFKSANEAVGQFITPTTGGDPVQIVGVVPDIRFDSLRKAPSPLMYGTDDKVRTITVRVSGDVNAVQQELETLWQKRFPNDVLHMSRANSFFAVEYGDDLRLAKILAAATLIAILIAAFGIYVLSAYSIQRRSQEIVLRKLYGANQGAIARLVGREFLILIIISACIGLPVAGIVAERYLANFVERAPIGIWPLLMAFVVAALIALLSTLRHTISAMRISPALILQR